MSAPTGHSQTTDPAAGIVLTVAGTARTIATGVAVSFGRGGTSPVTGEPVALSVDDHPALHRHAGTIEVLDEGWELTATGRLRLALVDASTGGRLWAVPGAPSLHVRLRRAIVELEPSAGHVVRIEMDDPRRAADGPVELRPNGDGEATDLTHVPRLDERAGYFRALVALCEPLLEPLGELHLPTDQQIAVRLNRSGRESKRQTVHSVEHRLAYARTRLGLAGAGAGGEIALARTKLAQFAVTSSSVRGDHLVLLDPDVDAGLVPR